MLCWNKGEIPGHKGHLKFQTESGFKTHTCVSIKLQTQKGKTNKIILVEKGNALYLPKKHFKATSVSHESRNNELSESSNITQ